MNLAHDATVGERCMGNKKFPTHTKTYHVDVQFAALLSLFLIRRYCWIDAARTNFTRTVTRDRFHLLTWNLWHKDDWRMSVSSTLVESDLTEAVLGEG